MGQHKGKSTNSQCLEARANQSSSDHADKTLTKAENPHIFSDVTADYHCLHFYPKLHLATFKNFILGLKLGGIPVILVIQLYLVHTSMIVGTSIGWSFGL